LIISVVIPTINEERSIAAAIDSAWNADADEVIVVDGGSTDQTVSIAQKGQAIVLSSCPGRSRQQNLGAQAANGDVIVFLHSDSRLQKHALVQLKAIQAKLGAFRQKIDARGWAYRFLEFGNNLRGMLFGMPYGDQTIFIAKDFFEREGGFPDVPLMEDYLLMRRLRWKHWPRILRASTYTSCRRWEKHGIVRQTLLNWSLILQLELGASPEQLASRYRRHDKPSDLQKAHTDA